MELGIFQFVLFILMVRLVGCSGVTVFNEDDTEEENVEDQLEMEHFIKVIDRRNNKPLKTLGFTTQKAEQCQPQSNSTLQDTSQLSGSFEQDGLALINKNTSQSPQVVLSVHEENSQLIGNGVRNKDTPHSRHRKDEKNFPPSTTWEDLAMWPDSKENEGGALNIRNKRAADLTSGDYVVEIEAVLNGSLSSSQQNDTSTENNILRKSIATGLQRYLMSSFKGVHFTVEVTKIVTPAIAFSADISYDENVVTRVQLAQAMHQLDLRDNFKVGNTIYSFSDPVLSINSNTNRLQPAICFLCRPYQSCKQRTYKEWFCKVSDNRLYPFGAEVNDNALPPNDEFVTAKIEIESYLPFDVALVDSLYISINGLISFEEEFSSFSPEPLPVLDDGGKARKLLCPYWSDLDKVSPDVGEVFYQTYTKNPQSNFEVLAVLNRTKEDVLLYSNEAVNFDPTTVVIATWSEMPPSPAEVSDEQRVTFQCIIITDGETTYVIYIYAQGAMNFNPVLEQAVVVGIGDSNLDSSRENLYHMDAVIGNTGNIGLWFFKVGYTSNNRAKCIQWYQSNIPLLPEIALWNRIITPCPCSEATAMMSFMWIKSQLQANCYDIYPMFGQFGRRCCYQDNGSFSFENRIPVAGSFQLFTPYHGDMISHEIHDASPKRLCCEETSLCQLFYEVRPTSTCCARTTEKGILFGDPHIVTLDSKSFIFNGLGEYRLLEIDGKTPSSKYINCTLQGRTCRMKTSDGRPLNATIFCAFAMINTNGSTVRVEISHSGDYMIIYINNRDFTVQFNNTASFSTSYGEIYIQKINDSLKVSTPDDIGLMISLKNNLLDFSVEINTNFQGMTKGLLGNFNHDSTDDFIFPNGTVLSQNVSERMLFGYGKTWSVTDSIFVYPHGRNTSSYTDSDFVPIFLDEVDPANLQTVYSFCGDKTNLPCVYDYFATQNEMVARNSREAVSAFHEDQNKAKNHPPVITGSLQLNATINHNSSLTLNAQDPDGDTLSFAFISSPIHGAFSHVVSGTTLKAFYTPVGLDPASLEVTAIDSKGQQSEIAAVSIRICSGCNNHGLCDFEHVLETHSQYFSVSSCVCFPSWSGKHCELDKNGCGNKPCPQGTNCTDVPASTEDVTGMAYSCSECPKGFQLNANVTKCEDIDECTLSENPCPSNANCTNKIGSYECNCNHGYRKNSKDECIDINECVENLHKCSQFCNNTDGSYECSCQEGFQLDAFGFSCLGSEDQCSTMTHNCSYGCYIDAGFARCFCEEGKQVAPDGSSCEDIDECKEKLCSQRCENNVGSYACSCFAGYILGQDDHSCELCPENQYGINCEKTCNCLGREVRCDHVKGCVCQDNWTGLHCENDVNECQTLAKPCPTSQSCENTFGSYTCTCPSGYADIYKNGSCVNINECDDPSVHQCLNKCVDSPGSFACVCADGYISSDNVCQDINECDSGISGCEHICVNVEGGFNCECRQGYYLANDRRACIKETDPCHRFNLSCEYACEVVNNRPVCYCQSGLQLADDGLHCVDIDECSSGSHKCTYTCVNYHASYSCACPDGMQLQTDKITCQACDGYHWGPNCSQECACDPQGSVACDPITGCQCKTGWGGLSCNEDKDECSQMVALCPSMSTCINTAGSFLCLCNPGFMLDGNNSCSDINECESSSPCDHNCTNTIGSYFCSCFTAGFRNDNGKCVDIDECRIPELSGCDQLCRNTQGGFACECYEGYTLNTTTRTLCYTTTLASACGTASACSGSCRVENGQEVCFCQPGFQLGLDNSTCTDINECELSPCVSGNCTNKNGTFVCACQDGMKLAADKVTCEVCEHGFYGPDCSKSCTCNVTNTRQCEPQTGLCECYSGWNGTDCSQDVDECYGQAADNCGIGALCMNLPGHFHCVCDVGFRSASGKCVDVNECLSPSQYRCVKNSRCRNTEGGYVCDCLQGFLRSSDHCTDTFVEYQVQITLLYKPDQINADVFNTSSDSFRNLSMEVERSLIEYGRQLSGLGLLDVKVSDFRQGSVIANVTMFIEAEDPDDAPRDVSRLLYQLEIDHELNISGTAVAVGDIIVMNKTLEPSDGKCGIYSFFATCPFCVEDSLTCQHGPPQEHDSGLLIGLAVGLPLFVLLAVTASVLACMYKRRKSKSTEQQTHLSVDIESPFRGKFPTRGFTGGSWGSRHHMYPADADSDAEAQASRRRNLFNTRQKDNLGILGFRWFTRPNSTDLYASFQETTAPSSETYWNNMLKLLEPDVNFEIQRPCVDTAPNPNFILRGCQPDTTAA